MKIDGPKLFLASIGIIFFFFALLVGNCRMYYEGPGTYLDIISYIFCLVGLIKCLKIVFYEDKN